jgi:hypothetical protein
MSRSRFDMPTPVQVPALTSSKETAHRLAGRVGRNGAPEHGLEALLPSWFPGADRGQWTRVPRVCFLTSPLCRCLHQFYINLREGRLAACHSLLAGQSWPSAFIRAFSLPERPRPFFGRRAPCARRKDSKCSCCFRVNRSRIARAFCLGAPPFSSAGSSFKGRLRRA